MKLSVSMCAVLIMLFMIPHLSSAALVQGIATDGNGNIVGDYWNEKIIYYIPIDSDSPPSGIYGVDGGGSVGRFPDSELASQVDGWLNMYIEFPRQFDYPAQMASVSFWWKDLDLEPDNDPDPFTETVRFSVWDSGSYIPITPVIDNTSDAAGNPFSITGDNDNRYITFNDVTSYLPESGSFKWLLEFTTAYDNSVLNGCDPLLWNTREKLSAKLETSPVPEPATMLLLGSGLVLVAGIGRKRIFKKKK